MKYPTLQRLVEDRQQRSPRATGMTVRDGLKWMQTHAPKQLANLVAGMEPEIYRGKTEHSGDQYTIRLMTPSASPRNARNTFDLYRAFSDAANPDWPQRSHSLICSSSVHYANDYGTLWAVFPPDGTQVAIAAESDFWCVGTLAANDFVTSMLDVAGELGIAVPNILGDDVDGQTVDRTPSTVGQWNDKVGQVRAIIQTWFGADSTDVDKYKSRDVRIEAFKTGMERQFGFGRTNPLLGRDALAWLLNDSTETYFDACKPHLDYNDLACKKRTIPYRPANLPGNREIWTDATCLTMMEQYVRDLVKAANEQSVTETPSPE